MKYITFEKMIISCKIAYENTIKRDKLLEDALGGDCRVSSEKSHIQDILNIIADDMGDTCETIDWLFWESLNSSSYPLTFEEKGITYNGNIINTWSLLKNKLNKYSGIKQNEIINKISENIKLIISESSFKKEQELLNVSNYLNKIRSMGDIYSYTAGNRNKGIVIELFESDSCDATELTFSIFQMHQNQTGRHNV